MDNLATGSRWGMMDEFTDEWLSHFPSKRRQCVTSLRLNHARHGKTIRRIVQIGGFGRPRINGEKTGSNREMRPESRSLVGRLI
jgi:hypothetical protein